MEVGKLYKFRNWGHQRSGLQGQHAVYLGEAFIHRDDGVTVENHKILKVGADAPSIIDRGMLKFMVEVEA
jgi:hypothetical protein